MSELLSAEVFVHKHTELELSGTHFTGLGFGLPLATFISHRPQETAAIPRHHEIIAVATSRKVEGAIKLDLPGLLKLCPWPTGTL